MKIIKEYIAPQIEIIELESERIVSTSDLNVTDRDVETVRSRERNLWNE